MMKIFLTGIFLLTLILFNTQTGFGKTKHNVLGIEVGMSRNEALILLKKIGKIDREESKQQEIWTLREEFHYSYIVIGFNKEKTEVRYITAKAREKGRPVRYSDVLDIKKARQTGTVNNYKYVLDVPASGEKAGYIVTARGQSPNYLTYFSIKKSEGKGIIN